MFALHSGWRASARAVVAVAAAAGLALTGACSSADSHSARDKGPMHSVTDVKGRTVEVPQNVTRVFLGGQRQIYTTALLNKANPIDRVVAWPDDLKENDPGTYDVYARAFPQLKDITTTGEVYDGSLSLEQVLDADPDVFVLSAANFDAADEAGIISGLDDAGIPTVTIDYFVDPVKNTVPSITLMGEILGKQAEAKQFTDYYQSKVDLVTSRLEKAHAQPTPTFLWRAPGYFDCCSTFNKSNLAQIVAAAGGQNLGDGMIDSKQGQVSPEALADKDPAVIIATGAAWDPAKTPAKEGTFVPLGYGEPLDKAAQDLKSVVDKQTVVRELKAVKDKRTFAAWHPFYDSPYNFLAIEFFAKAMHPELFADIDPQAEVAQLHEKFLPVPADGTFWTALP
ncbi:ABC transporter substrate-binding protein [Corynebacterium uberis]|uniref:ABC transporter substrate-binding protein n=1 Tax=Corynebacterium TaxID=1716 RepID=UPI001D0AA6D2|nr:MULTISPECIES: ABC transporter substrate-binding protein [Corynebacterium]MCZ9309860.1 ABC transporter substrate-binding protein [Corynebacterium sp. c6VSa_13]UDL73214.1 ABC transporter substrate-binding protein [Corynebacterium uberis]UDL75909.1 ABC transporter substrate-binding protein [Corynebacterium uberis]UDL78121.1 ABC transporter substrate-binding protein [Corynebacterium uberis]UDL80404.1 ABC transporter substrate-binding protein [Corynebacterium uberis]